MIRRRGSNFVFGIDQVSLLADRVQLCVPSRIGTEKELFEVFYVGLKFPDYFGGNWDAFDECIGDLSWLDPVQVVVIHEDLPMPADPASQAIYLSVLHDAVDRWTALPEHDLVIVFPIDCKSAVRDLMA